MLNGRYGIRQAKVCGTRGSIEGVSRTLLEQQALNQPHTLLLSFTAPTSGASMPSLGREGGHVCPERVGARTRGRASAYVGPFGCVVSLQEYCPVNNAFGHVFRPLSGFTINVSNGCMIGAILVGTRDGEHALRQRGKQSCLLWSSVPHRFY